MTIKQVGFVICGLKTGLFRQGYVGWYVNKHMPAVFVVNPQYLVWYTLQSWTHLYTMYTYQKNRLYF